MKKRDWMEKDEEPLGSWAVFVGENGPTSAKITGRLYATNRNVYFDAGLVLDQNAGFLMGGGSGGYHAEVKPPFQVVDQRLKIDRKRILRVYSSREWWILKSLHLQFDDGKEMVFRFGACPIGGAVAALES